VSRGSTRSQIASTNLRSEGEIIRLQLAIDFAAEDWRNRGVVERSYYAPSTVLRNFVPHGCIDFKLLPLCIRGTPGEQNHDSVGFGDAVVHERDRVVTHAEVECVHAGIVPRIPQMLGQLRSYGSVFLRVRYENVRNTHTELM